MKNYSFIISLFLVLFLNPTSAQVEVELTIQNQSVSGGNFQFDLYLRTTPTSSGDLYLGNADFALGFNASSFTSPSLTKVGTSPGACTFVPTDPSGLNTLFTQASYFDNTSPAGISGAEFVINLSGPTPGDQQAFDTRVAKVDGQVSLHRLGTFQLSGHNGGSVDLQWKTSGVGVITQVFTLESTSPFTSSPADLVALNPPGSPLPVELAWFTAIRVNETDALLEWETASENGADRFEIQRSPDGKNWGTIGEQKAMGEIVSRKKYEYLDHRAGHVANADGGIFYRLRMVDRDGSFGFSPVRRVAFPVAEKQMKVFPNPTKDVLNFSFPKPLDDGELSILGAKGERVSIQKLGHETEAGSLGVGHLPAGMYWLEVRSGGAVFTEKFQKI